MALPKDVQSAVAAADAAVVGCDDTIGVRQWQTIHAHLLSQDAEIERLQSRLAAADALLQRTQMKDYDAAAWLRLGVEIQAHLSENIHG